MINEIKELIQNEDKKNPYTDEQIGNLLNLRREQVTVLRQKEGIPDSRERRKPFVEEKMKEILEEDPGISERELTRRVLNCGFDISRYTIRQYRQELTEQNQPQLQPVETVGKKTEKTEEIKSSKGGVTISNVGDAFSHIIGYKGSLKPLIQQTKAAVLYPPRGLHTLILGEPGVGKSDLAEAMYNFAKEVKTVSESAPFIFFNCADYANNAQLLMAQLFGYVKGAFTGAETEREGLVEKANGGILFLDEVHRLPPEGQELLFYLMDRGKFRRLGETDALRRVDIMIVAATTENPESSLLVTFRRRIPMVVEIPSIALRPVSERKDLITEFFHKEARRTKATIEVSPEVIRALLLYECPGNIGQLLSDIQVACARGFLNYMINQIEKIKINVEDLPAHARKGLLKIQNRTKIENLITGNLVVHPDNQPVRGVFREDLYTLPSEIYQYIEQRYQELQNQDMTHDIINYIIGGELETRFKKMIKNIEASTRPLEKRDLVKIVGIEVVDIVEKILKIAERKLGIAGESLFYCLAIHLSTTLDRLRQGKAILNPQMPKVREDYPKEYKVAEEIVALIENIMNISLPEDEIGFVTMYLSTLTEKEESREEGRVGIVLISHGHVAEGMAEVANRLLGVIHAKSVEMSLDESPERALDRTMEIVKSAEEGKGVLLLVDMGSLVTFSEIITQRTDIKTRVVARTDTVMVIEAVRRAILPGVTLDEIADTLEESPKYITRLSKGSIKKNSRPKVLLTICITGEGSAKKVKDLIENLIPEIKEELEIIPIGAMTGNINKIIYDIKKSKQIIAVVGTVNPDVENVSFIPIEDIVMGPGITKIKELIDTEPPMSLQDVLDQETTFLNLKVETKNEAILEISKKMARLGYVKDDFARGAYEREALGPTYVGNNMAIPHADPSYVLKPSVAVARLKNKIDWDGQKVDLVFMLALHTSCHSIVQHLYHVINSDEFIKNYKKICNYKQLSALINNVHYLKEA